MRSNPPAPRRSRVPRSAYAWVLALVLAVSTLGACGSTSGNAGAGAGAGTGAAGKASTDGSGRTTESARFPVTIHHALGTTTIPKRPARVVAIGWGSQDAALALGVVPVGMTKGTFGDVGGLYPWETKALGAHGARHPTLLNTETAVPFEQIAALRPDVILAVQSGLTRADYQRLSSVAPTVAYPGKPWLTPWPTVTRVVGQALGQPKAADRLVRDTEAMITAAGTAHPELAGKTFAYGASNQPGTYNLYTAADPRVRLVTQLGPKVAPSVERLTTDPNAFYTQLSMERVDSVHADIWIAYYAGKSAEAKLKSDPVYAAIPAVRAHRDVALTDDTLTMATSSPSVLSLRWGLDRFVTMLAAAARR